LEKIEVKKVLGKIFLAVQMTCLGEQKRLKRELEGKSWKKLKVRKC